MDNSDPLLWNAKPRPPRVSVPGFKLWELRNGSQVLTCEIREDERVAAGVDVQLLFDGEILLSKRCVTGDAARFVAESFRQDHIRTGWAQPQPQ